MSGGEQSPLVDGDRTVEASRSVVLPAGLLVRAATAADLGTVHELELAVFGSESWSEPLLAAELTPRDVSSTGRCGFVASDGQRIVGYGLMRRTDDVGEILRIGVAAAFRRQGVGTALVEALLDTARDQRCTRVLLEVAADNTAALRCYAGLGFSEVHRRRGYYAGGTDALVLGATV